MSLSARGLARRLGGNLARGGRLAVARAALPRGRFWLALKLLPPFGETRPALPPWSRETRLGLLESLQALDAASRDPRVAGVLVRFAGAPLGVAEAFALRRTVEAVRQSGRAVLAYGERLGLADYCLASAADRICVPETGALALVGLRTEAVYLRDLLARLDVEPEVVRIGSHKTAGEAFTRSAMSPEQREQLDALLDDFYGEVVAAIGAGRRLEPAEVRARVDAGPYGAAAAVEAGLVDARRYPDELDDELEALADLRRVARRGAPARVPCVDAAVYHRWRAMDSGWRPLGRDLPRIAYVVAEGRIHAGRSSLPGGISAEGAGALLERLREDREVSAIVLRLTSPGGDALASDLIWRALHLTAREKPLVVSLGAVAASGGYYAAVGGRRILAEPTTVTGSIGVVGGKLNVAGLLDRLGVGREALERGARAGMLSASRGFTPDERAALRREMQALYEVFVARVAEARHLAPADVRRAAEGRVWSGLRAERLGLVDALGGPLEALAEARRALGIGEDAPALLDVHPRRTGVAGLRALVGVESGLR